MTTVYLQFDSQARSDAYIQKGIVPVGGGPPVLSWVPNDNYPSSSSSVSGPYQANRDLVQSPTNYRVFYKELNVTDNIRTSSFREHCKEHAQNIVFSVEMCVLTIPSSAVVARVDPYALPGTVPTITYNSIVNEPYIYVRLMDSDNAEGDLISSNNLNADDASFIVWFDSAQLGQTNVAPAYTPPPVIDGPVAPPPFPTRPVQNILTSTLTSVRYLRYKSAFATTMKINLSASMFYVRMYDRFGNDLILGEQDTFDSVGPVIGFPVASYPTPPGINPDIQTNLVVAVRPIYSSTE